MSEYVQRLNQLDVCAVSDALDKLGMKGAVTGIQRVSTDRRIAGRVVTVKLGLPDGRPAATRHLSTGAIEAASPGDIVVVEQRTGIDAAGWGGILSLGAKVRNIAGAIIEGSLRDVDDSRKVDFPVFARELTCTTARGRLIEAGTNVPIVVGSVTVAPGDYAIADGSAVAFVAESDIERVLAVAEEIAKREELMAQKIREGASISQVMGAQYENMLKR
jgi:4-hydroxy-4-methyl-2-oxoglutarate aldolase